MKRPVIVAAAIAVLALGFGTWWFVGPMHRTMMGEAHHAGINVPQLTASAQAGEALFQENCAACHGRNATGTDLGPPLVHKIYEPGHHGDMAFQMAAKNGVRAHHWRFGDMPPVPGVSEAEVSKIVTYVRELQRANGIE